MTRDVSQLSGWLKAVAYCRGSQAGHTVRGAGCGPQEAERGERLRCARSMQLTGSVSQLIALGQRGLQLPRLFLQVSAQRCDFPLILLFSVRILASQGVILLL